MARTKANVAKLVKARVNDAGEAKKPRKPIKYKWGTRAIREIKRAQRGVEPLVPRAAIARVIRQTAAAFSTKPRIAPDAIDALRTASEDIIIEHMKRAYKYTMIARKQTLSPEHMQAAADDMIREVNRAATR